MVIRTMREMVKKMGIHKRIDPIARMKVKVLMTVQMMLTDHDDINQ